MPLTNWTTTIINGREFLVIDVAQFRIPLDWDPSSNMFFAVAAPDGGLGGFQALVQGDDGVTPDIETVINFTPLAWDDPTPDSASWTETSEGVYRLNLQLHKGSPGDPGAFNLDDAENLPGTPTAGRVIAVNEDGDGFEYVSQKVGDQYWPAVINNTPSGNPSYTLCSVAIPAQPFDWRPDVSGWCIIQGVGADLRCDLIARLNNATAGNIVGRGRYAEAFDLAPNNPCVLSSGPPAGSALDYNKVNAGDGAIIYLRAERQSGSNTFTTSASNTYFSVWVRPIP